MAKKLTFEQLPGAVALLLEEVAEIKKMLKANDLPSRNKAASLPSAAEPACDEVDLDQVCSMLQRTKQTVYGLVKSGLLKPRKQGRKLLFSLAEVEKYINNPKKKARRRGKASVAKTTTEVAPAPAPAESDNEGEVAPVPVENGKKRGWPLGRKRN